jgi:hypothetical protein
MRGHTTRVDLKPASDHRQLRCCASPNKKRTIRRADGAHCEGTLRNRTQRFLAKSEATRRTSA